MLFKSTDLEHLPALQLDSSTADQGELDNFHFQNKAALSILLSGLKMGKTYHYNTGGSWSSHELLLKVLAITGPAHVHIATWSLKETPLRMIVKAISLGQILSVKALVDSRVKIQTPEVFAMAELNFLAIKTSACHAKVTVVTNDDWGVAIVGSSNYTTNPRIEAGVISCSFDTAKFHQAWINEAISSAK